MQLILVSVKPHVVSHDNGISEPFRWRGCHLRGKPWVIKWHVRDQSSTLSTESPSCCQVAQNL